MEKGWFKTYRLLWDKPIWTGSTPEQKVVLMTLLSMANYEEREWDWNGRAYSAKPGQMITSLASLKEKCGKNISVHQIRIALRRFEKYGFLTNESTTQNRLITIVNWDIYQQNDYTKTKHLANVGQTDGKPAATKKNYKNDKKEKNIRKRSFAYAKPVKEFQFDLTRGEAL